jgi:hypothetical protein
MCKRASGSKISGFPNWIFQPWAVDWFKGEFTGTPHLSGKTNG